MFTGTVKTTIARLRAKLGDPAQGCLVHTVTVIRFDLRDGDLRGCLMKWEREGGVTACWPSIAVMLAEIADALEHGRPEGRDPTGEEIAHRTRTGHLAVFTADGRLTWQAYDREQARTRQQEIAAWARSQGYPMGERGRIPRSVMEAYERRQER